MRSILQGKAMIRKILTVLEPYFEFLVVMVIRNRHGEEHFKRWRLLWLPWYGDILYLHKISKSDADPDRHNHPWDFWSLILAGAYEEDFVKNGHYHRWLEEKHQRARWGMLPGNLPKSVQVFGAGDLIKRRARDFHRIKLLDAPVWSLVWVGRRHPSPWGYATPRVFMDSESYRKMQNERSRIDHDVCSS